MDISVLKNFVSLNRDFLISSKINAVYNSDKRIYHFLIQNKRNEFFELIFSLKSELQYVFINFEESIDDVFQTKVSSALENSIYSSYIEDLQLFNRDRVIKLTLRHVGKFNKNQYFFLFLEFTGRFGNLILTDEENKIIFAHKFVNSEARAILKNETYVPPPKNEEMLISEKPIEDFIYEYKSTEKPNQYLLKNYCIVSPMVIKYLKKIDIINIPQKVYNTLLKIETAVPDSWMLFFDEERDVKDFHFLKYIDSDFKVFNLYNECVNYLFRYSYYKSEMKKLRTEVKTYLKKQIEKYRKRVYEAEKKFREIKNIEKYRIYGELLLNSNIDFVNDVVLETLNYYTGNKIAIPIDSSLSIKKNAEKYFNKSRKLKQVSETLDARFNIDVRKLNEYENYFDKIEESDFLVRELHARAEKLLYRKKKGQTTKKSKKTNYHTYWEGSYRILVGKNNKSNEYITFRLANSSDLWFHIKDYPGSHVIIKREGKNEEVPEKIKEKAAELALFYSKARSIGKGEVDYTERKFVKHHPSGDPGLVHYENFGTIHAVLNMDSL